MPAGFMIGLGASILDAIIGIRIRKLDESSPDLITMLLRNVLGGLFYGLTFGVGFIISICMVLIRTDNRAMHDLIARTEVVYK